MKFSTIRAFGLVWTINDHSVGDVFYVNIPEGGGRCIIYPISGTYNIKDLESGQEYNSWNSWKIDFTYMKYEPAKRLQYTCVEDAKVFCFDPRLNRNQSPDFTKVRLTPAEQLVLPLRTKLFLMGGSLTLNGVEYVGPTRISVENNAVTCTATTDCYGLLVP